MVHNSNSFHVNKSNNSMGSQSMFINIHNEGNHYNAMLSYQKKNWSDTLASTGYLGLAFLAGGA